MCQIDFTIQFTDPEMDSLQAAEGRYKLQSAGTFEPVFTINLSNPQTPDINVNGTYDLEVRVQDTAGNWSGWFATTFEVADSCSPAASPYVIGEGDCNTRVSTITTTDVWIDLTNGGDPSLLDVGDAVFLDAAMTNRFVPSSNSQPHRIGIRTPSGAILWTDTEYRLTTVTPTGVISKADPCSGGGGGDAEIITSQIDANCDSCLVVRVTVPAGETRQVITSKSGLANWIGGNQSGCTADVMAVTNTYNINTTTTFALILDAEDGNGGGTSTATLSVTGSNSVTLQRTHDSSPAFC